MSLFGVSLSDFAKIINDIKEFIFDNLKIIKGDINKLDTTVNQLNDQIAKLQATIEQHVIDQQEHTTGYIDYDESPPPKPAYKRRRNYRDLTKAFTTKAVSDAMVARGLQWVKCGQIVQDIIKCNSGSAHAIAKRVLNELTDTGFLEHKRRGRFYEYRVKQIPPYGHNNKDALDRKKYLTMLLWQLEGKVTIEEFCEHYGIDDKQERNKIKVNFANYADQRSRGNNNPFIKSQKDLSGELIYWCDRDPSI